LRRLFYLARIPVREFCVRLSRDAQPSQYHQLGFVSLPFAHTVGGFDQS
jgi:hypothetical protein